MERLFSNFQFNSELFIIVGLFLTIAFIITIIIVTFMSRIKTLEFILEQAKEIDEAKINKIAELNEELQTARLENANLYRELEFFAQTKEEIKGYKEQITHMQTLLNDQSKEHLESFHHQQTEYKQLKIRYELLGEHLTKIEDQYDELQKRNEKLIEDNTQLNTRIRETEVQIMEQQKQTSEKLEMMKEHRLELKQEFEQLALKVFDRNSKEFSKLSQENISSMIKPLETQISEFKKQVQSLYSDESKDRAMLKQEILSLKELNQQISQDAINLTNALKGEKKQQGIWGEMILEKVLESSGLRKGKEYTREVSLRNSEGVTYRPDVLVHLPDQRDLIIDSKTSLNAYERFVNAAEESEREKYLAEHITALRNHMKSLSAKNYEKLLGINSLDFIFMFVPIEGALAVALEHDAALYDDAFKNQILLVGPTTLLIAMRAIENVWKYEKQNQNAREIAERAGALYDKFVNFSDDIVKISKQFQGLHGSFESAKKRLSEGKGNLIRQVEQLKEMGAKTNKQIPYEMKQG